MSKVLFSEKQQFTQWWLWLIIFILNAFFVYAMYQQIIMDEKIGDNPLSNRALLFVSLGFLLFSLFFIVLKLETEIREDGIYVRFFPIGIHYKHIPWDTIQKAEIRTYRPLLEFGGWGIRYGDGKALNVSGKIGLQILFKDGGKLLIGTQKPNELGKIISEKIKP